MKYIVFEGSDGSGKTYVMNKVLEAMDIYFKQKNISIIKTKEPGCPEIDLNVNIRKALACKKISGINREIALVMDRLLHFDYIDSKKYNNKHVIVSDRSMISGLIYSKIHKFKPEEKKLLDELHKFALQKFFSYKPIILVMDVSYKTALIRIKNRHNINDLYENLDVYDNLRKIVDYYRDICSIVEKAGSGFCPEIWHINNNEGCPSVADCIDLLERTL